MNAVSGDRRSVGVWVDHSTLRGEVAGSDTLYRVSLAGAVDERWLETCASALLESTALRRFRLDRTGRSVAFTCRTVDGPGLVMDALERLEALLARVNRHVEARPAHPEPAPASNAGPRGFA